MATRYDYVHGRHKSVFVRNMYKVLKVVKRNINYLKDHPKQLAWVMYEYTKLDWASRFENGESYHGNPKYPVIELGNELENEELSNLIYDAWGAGIDNYDQIRKYSKAELKPNKTMEDYYNLWLDPNYRYKSIFPTKKAVECHLLCTNGTGMGWNKDGYITDIGPSGTDDAIFLNFQLVGRSVPQKIKDKLPHLKDDSIQKAIKSYKKELKKSHSKYNIDLERDYMKETKDKFIKMILEKFPDKNKKDYENMDVFKVLNEYFDLTATPEQKEKRKKEEEKRKKEEKKERESQIAHSKYYPMTAADWGARYSRLTSMPDNAHESYIKAGIRICARILGNPHEETDTHIDPKTKKKKTYKRDNPEVAIKFLQKWSPKYPEYTNQVFEDVETLWEEFPWMIQEMKDYGLIKEEVCENLFI